jgi:hypothetical protein
VIRWALLLALLLAGCAGGVESMAWRVDESTTAEALDGRFRSEVAALDRCTDYDWLAECPQYHRIWRRYWDARRALADRQ